ncbi:hypothetical protein F7234_12150 [Pseudomonas putida]|uniref:hypothetical protein n=1 Tax=Pseudomonas putida TaxID=303 RepID=UPI00125FE274|nr:hypothetical protein [Pseudomonas putida]KAB5624019.1 hypothetical protein F7234_12150 [Pseudomonas putida]
MPNTMPHHHGRHVNAAQIIVCAANLAERTQLDIMQSALLAQLVADKSATQSAGDWQHKYSNNLLRSSWLRSKHTVIRPDLTNRSMAELISMSASEALDKTAWRQALSDLHHPLNAPALAVLHESIIKPAGLYLELVMVHSAKSIHTLGLTLEHMQLPTGKDWLDKALVCTDKTVGSHVELNTYELQPRYRNVRDSVEEKLGEWPQKLTIPLHSVDEPDGLIEPSV